MFLLRVGNFVVNNRYWTALIAALLTVSLSLFAFIILGLVTLRKGWQEGLLLLLVMVLVCSIVFWSGYLASLNLIVELFVSCLVWLLAITLRYYNNWGKTVQAGAIVSLLVIVLSWSIYPDGQLLPQEFTQHPEQAKALIAMFGQVPANSLQLMLVGMILVGATCFSVLMLVLARWWQAALFNPGQLQPELHNIRVSRSFAVLFIAVLLIALLTHYIVIWNVLLVLMLPFLIAGLSLVHRLAALKSKPILWLSGFYIILLLFYHLVVLVMILLGLIDSGLNLRARIHAQKQ